MLKQALKALIPPLIWSGLKTLKPKPPGPPADQLFEGDDALFKRVMADCKVYGEHGCGASTRWVLEHSRAQILAVDSSREWIDVVTDGFSQEELARVRLQHVDLGLLSEWGRPVGYANRAAFAEYTDWIWQQDVKPDTVLIDGRFRVCCFYSALKHAEPGTRILFDDYNNRPRYHLVEDTLPAAERCGRQALFIVPERGVLDTGAIDREIANFRHVMD